MYIRTKVNKRVVQTRLGESGLRRTIRISVLTVVSIRIVVVAIATTKKVAHISLNILYIGRGIRHVGHSRRIGVVYHCNGIGVDTVQEVALIHDSSAQVVTTIDVVTHPRESQHILAIGIHAITSHVDLRMAVDVGITATSKGVEHTTIT